MSCFAAFKRLMVSVSAWDLFSFALTSNCSSFVFACSTCARTLSSNAFSELDVCAFVGVAVAHVRQASAQDGRADEEERGERKDRTTVVRPLLSDVYKLMARQYEQRDRDGPAVRTYSLRAAAGSTLAAISAGTRHAIPLTARLAADVSTTSELSNTTNCPTVLARPSRPLCR